MVHQSQFIEMFGRVSDKQPKYPIMKLSECCSYISDGSHFSPEGDSNGSYPMLSVKDMTETGFSYSDCKFIGEKDYNNLVQNGCKPLCGDVLVAKDGSFFKYAFALSDEKEQAILSSIAILRPIQVFISSRYLAYYMLTDAVIQLVEDNYLTGTAIKRVILKGFKEIPIIVPPLDSQNVFVCVLERADKSKFDGLKSQFIEMFGDIKTTSFPVYKLGEICDIHRGGSPRPISEYITNDPDGLNWIKIGDADEGMYISHTAEKIKPSGLNKTRKVYAGDLLLSNSMSFGHPYILRIDGCIHDGWLVLHFNHKNIEAEYLCSYLSQDSTYQELSKLAAGGVVNNLNSEVVKILPTILPPIEEQRKYLAVLHQADKSKYLN